jgi:(2Fe-2S) ferredoxin
VSDRTYCSAEIARIGEPLAGTATPTRHLFLVSWPKVQWAAEALETPGLPEGLAGFGARMSADHGKVTVRLICRPGMPRDGLTVIAWPSALRYNSVRPEDLVALLTAHLEGHATGGAPLGGQVVAVCTHGKHDACCARWGQRVYERFAALAGPDAEVWESSHLGGHRFAATAIALPEGHMYGRLTEADVPEVWAASRAGRIAHRFYRGRIGLDESAQVAEAMAQARFAPDGEALPVELEARPDGGWIVRTDCGAAVVYIAKAPFEGPKGCDELERPTRWERPVCIGFDLLRRSRP